MVFERQSGLFLHLTALPGPRGVGTLGAPARRFVDFLQRAGQSLWQFCPTGPTSAGSFNSPYQSYSAFAGEPLLIDLDDLVARGLLEPADLEPVPEFDPHRVEYERVREYKRPLLGLAFERFEAGDHEDSASETTGSDASTHRRFDAFRDREASWLGDYTLFRALHEHFDGAGWIEWPGPVAGRDPGTLDRYRDRLAAAIRYREFVQFLFAEQWDALTAYAHERGIDLVGDLPIYVAHDSADVWADQDAFQLDETGRPTHVAGVPPNDDAGQIWGTPVYDWDHLVATGYDWWRRRFERLYDLVDVVRIDHFPGFVHYYAVPTGSEDPAAGEWREGPGRDLFAAVASEATGVPANHPDELPVIVEDFGFVSDAVRAVRDGCQFPSMQLLQFAAWCVEDHEYQPHTYPEASAAFASTHDHPPVAAYYDDLDADTRECLHYYLDSDGSEIHWQLIDAVWGSASRLAIAQLQDVLGLGAQTRFNTPGTTVGNWEWRVTAAGLDPDVADRLAGYTEQHDR